MAVVMKTVKREKYDIIHGNERKKKKVLEQKM